MAVTTLHFHGDDVMVRTRYIDVMMMISVLDLITLNRICSVMLNMLASSGVDHEFKLRSAQTKDYKTGICCFSTKNAVLKSKNKDKLNHTFYSVYSFCSCHYKFQILNIYFTYISADFSGFKSFGNFSWQFGHSYSLSVLKKIIDYYENSWQHYINMDSTIVIFAWKHWST
jgi:hypothetical protein